MSKQDQISNERRKVLKILGMSAATVPLAVLSACSGDKAPPPAAPAPEPKADEPAPKPAAVEEIEDAVSDAAAEAPSEVELATLSEDDPSAKALGYVEDATTVDAAKYPRYEAGQACSNCALYAGGDAAEGACSIFPGKAVKATGWCSVYAPKA